MFPEKNPSKKGLDFYLKISYNKNIIIKGVNYGINKRRS